jgi:DNA-binding MarR family transcriptional regulator
LNPRPAGAIVQRVNITGADSETRILQLIHGSRRVRQRDLAHVVGLSLGMTNAILKRLALKGLIVIRKVNNRNVLYAVSPAGLREIARRSASYLRRSVRAVVDYRKAIEGLVADAKRSGCSRIVLVGRSDLDFILEHACARARVELRREPAGGAARRRPADTFVLYSERRTAHPPEAGLTAGLGDLLAVVHGREGSRGKGRLS